MQQNTKLWLGINGIIKLHEKMLKKVCEKYSLTLNEAEIIAFISRNPKLDTAADIVEYRMLSKGCVSKAVEALMEKGFLERTQDTEDRRKMHLSLTEKTGPVLESIDEVQEELWNTIFDGFTEEEMDAYNQFKDRMFMNTRRAMEGRTRV